MAILNVWHGDSTPSHHKSQGTGPLSSLRLCLGRNHSPTLAPGTGPASLLLGTLRPDGAEDGTLVLITGPESLLFCTRQR